MDRIFKNSNGRYRTSDLFEEFNISEYPAYWTLKGVDTKLPSLKKIFLSYEDITEYDFAVDHFEDFAHWEEISRSPRIKEHVEQWRKELLLKIKARALKGIIHDAVKDNKFECNKFLLTNGWVDKTEGPKRGRPSKEEIKQELHRQAETEKDLMDDLNRIKELN